MDVRHRDIPEALNAVSDSVIGAAIEVRRELGPGLLERVYEEALAHELSLRGLRAARQAELHVEYEGLTMSGGRVDLIVEGNVIVELKAVDKVADVHLAQLVSYLRAAGAPLGLLLNFNVPVMKQGVYRRVNSACLAPASSSAISAPPRSCSSD